MIIDVDAKENRRNPPRASRRTALALHHVTRSIFVTASCRSRFQRRLDVNAGPTELAVGRLIPDAAATHCAREAVPRDQMGWGSDERKFVGAGGGNVFAREGTSAALNTSDVEGGVDTTRTGG